MKNLTHKKHVQLNEIPVLGAALIIGLANIVLINLSTVNKCTLLIILMTVNVVVSFFFMFFQNFTKAQVVSSLNLFWYAFLLFAFPLTSTFLVLENQESFWFYIYFLVTLFYVLNVVKLKHVDFLIILSVLCAFSFDKLAVGNAFYLSPQIKYFYGTVACFIFFVSYYIFKISKASQEQIQKLRLLGGAIAHEIRTPLSAIISGAHGLKKAMPALVENYKIHSQTVNSPQNYSSYQLDALLESPDAIMQTAQEGSMMIDMLLMKIKTDNTPLEYSTQVSATAICQQALNTFPFRLGEFDKVKLNTSNDFFFYTNEKAFKNVILNLLKNALYQIIKNQRGEIEIWFSVNNRYNTIHFKDTASGIKENDLINLFTESHRISENGTGIGLPFCKLIVENSGGNIECRSVFGEYTEFILQFPTITLTKETQ